MLATLSMLLVVGATLAWMVCAWRVRMPANRLPFIAAWSLGALLGVAVLLGNAPGSGMALTAVVLGGVLLFLASTSRQRAGAQAIAVGDRIPEFTAPNERGEMVNSDTYAGSQLLLKFFRGHW